MSTSRGEPPVERFMPTSGFLVGYAGVVIAVVALGYVAVRVHTTTGALVALAAVFGGVVVWVTQLRPRVTAYRHSLLVRGSLRDWLIPLRSVDGVSVGHTLNIWVGEQRFVCIGIGSSLRAMTKRRRRRQPRQSLLGSSRWHEFAERAERAAPDQTAMSYDQFVVTRIEELVEQAKKEPGGDVPPAEPRSTPAWPEIVLLALSGAGFLVALLV
jgi:hypothetical protein